MTKTAFINSTALSNVQIIETDAGAANTVGPTVAGTWVPALLQDEADTVTTAVPTYVPALGAVAAGETIGIPGSGANVEPTLTGGPGSPAGTFTWTFAVNGSPETGIYETVDGDVLVFTIADANHQLGAYSASSTAVTVAGTAEITAVTQPTALVLHARQTLEGGIPNFATLDSEANYSSTAGTIDIVEWRVGGSDEAGSFMLSKDDVVVLYVEDSEGNFRTWPIAVVQYLATVSQSATNKAVIDVNPVVDDAFVVPIVFSGGTDYDGSYSPTAGDLRGDYHPLAGTAGIDYIGDEEDLAVGDSITIDPGLWMTQTGTLDLGFQTLRAGVDIAGATEDLYALKFADLGQVISCEVTANDGENAPATIVAGSVTPPAGVSVGDDPVHFLTDFVPGASRNVDFSEYTEDDEIYFIAHIGMTSSETNRITNLTVNGATVTPPTIVNANSRNQVAVGKFVVGADWETIAISVNGSSAANSSALTLFKANGWTNPTYAVDNGGSGTDLVETEVSVLSGDRVLASASDSGRGQAPSLSGVTQVAVTPATGYDDTYHVTSGAAEIAEDDATYAVQATLPLASQMALGTIVLSSQGA